MLHREFGLLLLNKIQDMILNVNASLIIFKAIQYHKSYLTSINHPKLAVGNWYDLSAYEIFTQSPRQCLSLCRMMLRDNSFVQTFRHEKTLVSTGVTDMDISETLQKRYLNVHLFYTFICPPTKHWYLWKPMRIMFDRQRLLLSILIWVFLPVPSIDDRSFSASAAGSKFLTVIIVPRTFVPLWVTRSR